MNFLKILKKKFFSEKLKKKLNLNDDVLKIIFEFSSININYFIKNNKIIFYCDRCKLIDNNINHYKFKDEYYQYCSECKKLVSEFEIDCDDNVFTSIKFPEFTGKLINEIMPYNAGFIGVSNISVSKKLLQICLELPTRFHYWYGDQVALKKIHDTKEFKISVLDSNYNYRLTDLSNYDKNIFVYHFKGRFKGLMKPFYERYSKYFENK